MSLNVERILSEVDFLKENGIKEEHCRRCGAILNRYGICIKCGKRYINLKREWKMRNRVTILFAIFSTILFISTIAFAVLFFSSRIAVNRLSSDMGAKSAKIEDLQSSYDEITKKVEDTKEEYARLEKLLSEYETDFAYVTDTGSKYHKLDCSHLKGANLYINTIQNFKEQGYTKCLDCYSDNKMSKEERDERWIKFMQHTMTDDIRQSIWRRN